MWVWHLLVCCRMNCWRWIGRTKRKIIARISMVSCGLAWDTWVAAQIVIAFTLHRRWITWYCTQNVFLPNYASSPEAFKHRSLYVIPMPALRKSRNHWMSLSSKCFTQDVRPGVSAFLFFVCKSSFRYNRLRQIWFGCTPNALAIEQRYSSCCCHWSVCSRTLSLSAMVNHFLTIVGRQLSWLYRNLSMQIRNLWFKRRKKNEAISIWSSLLLMLPYICIHLFGIVYIPWVWECKNYSRVCTSRVHTI